MRMTISAIFATVMGLMITSAFHATAQDVHRALAIEISIREVSIDPVQNVPDAGDNRMVPVRIAWTTGPWGDRKLLNLEARLQVTNSDGSTTDVKKTLAVRGHDDVLLLSVPEGAKPISYMLEIAGDCQFKDAEGMERVEPSKASKAGNF